MNTKSFPNDIPGFGGFVRRNVARFPMVVELVAAAIAIAVELGLGILLLIGFQTRWAALGIAIFTLVITFIFHKFWGIPAEMVMSQQQAFFKNIGVVGGLLTIAAWGAGAWSVDGKLNK